MATYAWDNSRYDGATTNANLIDDEARRLRQEIADLLMQGSRRIGGNTPPASSATNNDDGKVCVGWETQTFQSDAGFTTLLWDFLGTTALLRAYGTSHATKPGQIEPQGIMKFVGPNITSGLDPGHLHTQGGIIGGRAGLIGATGYLKPSAYRWSKGAGEGTQTVTLLGMRVGTAPSGGSLIIEIRKTNGAPSTASDVYGDGVASLVVGTITITTGNFEGSTTTLANNTLADGEYLVPKVTTLNGAPADLSIYAVVTG